MSSSTTTTSPPRRRSRLDVTQADGLISNRPDHNTPPHHRPAPTRYRAHSLVAAPALDDNSILHLLRDHDLALARRAQGVHHDIVREHVELLLVLALDVGVPGETDEVDEPGFADVRGDVFGGDLGVSERGTGTGRPREGGGR